MPTFDHPYLDLARMEMLRRVRLTPQGEAEGTFAGPHRSHFRGSSVEFADYRNYVDGDDIRLVDWKVYARSDRYYVRLYEEERNLLSYLLVDTSGSMGFAGVERLTTSKLAYACQLAAALAFLVIDEGDEAGLSLANSQVHTHLQPTASWPHLARIADQLGQTQAAGKTDLGACLQQVYQRIERRGVLILFSDFLDHSPTLWQAIDLFRRSRFSVILFHLVHPEELELPAVPLARFQDMEGGSGHFDAEPEVVRTRYQQRFAQFLRSVDTKAGQRGCELHLARTDIDPYIFLERCLLSGAKRR